MTKRKAITSEKCISCGLCTKGCSFLDRHGMDLREYESFKYMNHGECMLCGHCQRVCPKGIDGREITLRIREELDKSGRLKVKPYRATLLEKKDYIFKNYSGGRKRTVFFPGCNFPSFFPKGTEAVYSMLRDEFDAGIVFDCCSKPIGEMGLKGESMDYIRRMGERMASMGVEEVITACPNCYYYLKDRLSIPVVDVYTKMGEKEMLRGMALGNVMKRMDPKMKGEGGKARADVFSPCPDKDTFELLESIHNLLGGRVEFKPVTAINCCGLGGMAAAIVRDLPRRKVEKLKERHSGGLYTYCATCYGNLKRNGYDGMRHILMEMLDVDEAMPKGIRSIVNRASFRFRRDF